MNKLLHVDGVRIEQSVQPLRLLGIGALPNNCKISTVAWPEEGNDKDDITVLSGILLGQYNTNLFAKFLPDNVIDKEIQLLNNDGKISFVLHSPPSLVAHSYYELYDTKMNYIGKVKRYAKMNPLYVKFIIYNNEDQPVWWIKGKKYPGWYDYTNHLPFINMTTGTNSVFLEEGKNPLL